MAGVEWSERVRGSWGAPKVERVSWTPRRRLEARALRGPTTLEHQALPGMILGSLGVLALIQVILTWP